MLKTLIEEVLSLLVISITFMYLVLRFLEYLVIRNII